jgi:hypothetical protein
MTVFFVVFNSIIALCVLAAAMLVLLWEFRKKRDIEKTYMYHLRIILNSGKVLHLTLDDALYQQFNQLLQAETGKFQITTPSKSDPQIQDASTTLYVQYIAAVSMRRW